MHYVDVTEKWLSKANKNVKIIKDAKYVIKNNKRYYVNKTNKIRHENREIENAEWFINIFGGKLVYLPKIDEASGVLCSDYRYYPNGNGKIFFLEEKETKGKGLNVFYHALENHNMQANIFLIDCTDSQLSNKELLNRIDIVFKSSKTSFVKAIIIKKNNKLLGVYKKK